MGDEENFISLGTVALAHILSTVSCQKRKNLLALGISF